MRCLALYAFSPSLLLCAPSFSLSSLSITLSQHRLALYSALCQLAHRWVCCSHQTTWFTLSNAISTQISNHFLCSCHSCGTLAVLYICVSPLNPVAKNSFGDLFGGKCCCSAAIILHQTVLHDFSINDMIPLYVYYYSAWCRRIFSLSHFVGASAAQPLNAVCHVSLMRNPQCNQVHSVETSQFGWRLRKKKFNFAPTALNFTRSAFALKTMEITETKNPQYGTTKFYRFHSYCVLDAVQQRSSTAALLWAGSSPTW